VDSEHTAQLYRDKESSMFFDIGIIGDLDPNVRHLQVLPLFAVGGPNAPEIRDSLALHTLAHIAGPGFTCTLHLGDSKSCRNGESLLPSSRAF
jgi:hypothetical protein